MRKKPWVEPPWWVLFRFRRSQSRQVEREDEELPERLRDFIWIFVYLFLWTVRGREKMNGTGRMERAKRVRRTKHTNGTEKDSENR